MKFKENELYLVGTDTHLCLQANEDVAVLVPVPMKDALLYHQSGLPVKTLEEGINTDFKSRPIDGVTFAPGFLERLKPRPEPEKRDHLFSQLEFLRRLKKLSQLELARLAGLHSTVITQVERGHRKPWPKFRTKVAQALDVDESELFDANGGLIRASLEELQ